MIKLQTQHLLIRDHIPDDLNGLHRLLTNDQAMRFLQDLKTVTLEESKLNLETSLREAKRKAPEERECYFFAITKRNERGEEEWASYDYIGEIGYTVKNRSDRGAIVGLGYFIHPDYWGQGIVTEAVQRVMAYAFEENDVWKIEVGCNKGNGGSERVMIKNGFLKEGEFVDHTWLEGRLWNRVEYRLLKPEWQARQYGEKLLTWYHEVHRKLPWRETHDPYKIWVSEVMLQQTQVDTVIGYYERFISELPTVWDLARADEDRVLKLWEGLGYYSRARRLMQCARVIVEQHQGQFPEAYEALLKLPGIGPYTAGAVSSIAFNERTHAVDGNVMRVLARQFDIREDIGMPATRKIFEDKVMELLPDDRRHFNQALMELGATVCTPKNPRCTVCPVVMMCAANRLNSQNELPVKMKKVKKSTHVMAMALVQSCGKLLLTKRASEGLLANLWALPAAEIEAGSSQDQAVRVLEEELENALGLKARYTGKHCEGRHVFTHRIWEMHLYTFESDEQPLIDYPPTVWVDELSMMQYAMPTAFAKMLDEMRRTEGGF